MSKGKNHRAMGKEVGRKPEDASSTSVRKIPVERKDSAEKVGRVVSMRTADVINNLKQRVLRVQELHPSALTNILKKQRKPALRKRAHSRHPSPSSPECPAEVKPCRSSAGAPAEKGKIKERQKSNCQFRYNPRWRTEFLIDHDVKNNELVCMACEKTLARVNLHAVKRHVEHCHVDSLALPKPVRRTIVNMWNTKKYSSAEKTVAPKHKGKKRQSSSTPSVDMEDNLGIRFPPGGKKKDPNCTPAVEKERLVLHRRFFQDYWRTQYLIEYDWRRNGLICMICGTTMTTLRLCTIKRHIQRKHPYSLKYSSEKKRRIIETWKTKHR